MVRRWSTGAHFLILNYPSAECVPARKLSGGFSAGEEGAHFLILHYPPETTVRSERKLDH
jgi:hypothetical protein